MFLRIFFSLLLLFLHGFVAAQAPSEVEVVLAPGQPLGVQPRAFFRSTLSVARNAAGHMLLLAEYCRQSPTDGPCQTAYNFFLLDDQGIRALINDETRPPGLSLESFPTTLQLTDSGRILMAQREGILRLDDGRLGWLARRGDLAPGVSFEGNALHFEQFRVSDRFAREDGGVVFSATLDDQSSGVFEIDGRTVRRILADGETPPGSSEPLPNRSLIAAAPVVAGALAAFPLGPPGMQSLLLHDGTALRQIAKRGQTLDGVVVESVGRFDLNAAGQVAFEVRYRNASEALDSHLFLYQNGQSSSLTSARPLPGLVDTPIASLTGPFVTDFGEIYFGATQLFGFGGIFCWRSGRVTKIAADGDVVWGGKSMTVTFSENTGIPFPPSGQPPGQMISRPRSPGELAFQARLSDEVGGLRSLIWRAGDLEVVDLNLRLLPGSLEQIVQSVSPVDSDAAGRVLLRAYLCCGLLQEALLLTGSAQGSRLYVPYVVRGDFSAEISYATRLFISNLGSHTALFETTTIGDFPAPGPGPFPFYRQQLGAGRLDQLFIPAVPGTGFVRIDNLQGGPLAVHGLVQLAQNLSLTSETALESQSPLTQARLVVDSSPGDRVGVALSNPGSEALEVEWSVIDESARLLDSGVLELDANEQRALFIDELAAGIPEFFLGALLLRCETPFLAAGLRLNGLQLSTIPLETASPASLSYGFSKLASFAPTFFETRLRQVLLGPADEQAVVTPDGQLQVITGEGLRVLFGPDRPLTEAQFSNLHPSEIQLVDYGPLGLLFFLSPGVGRPGLFLWDGVHVRRLIRNGESLPGGAQVVMGTFSEEFAVNRSGQIALGVNALFRRETDGAITPILLETDSIPGGGQTYGAIVSVDINDSGAMGFASARAVGLAGASGVQIVAQAGQQFGPGFIITGFERVRITSDGHLYFTATGFDPMTPPGLISGAPVSGLFFFDGALTHPMLITGTPVTPDGRIRITQVADLGLELGSASPIKLNRQDQLAVFATLGAEPSIFAGGFFLLANTTSAPQVLVADLAVDAASPLRLESFFSNFGWNDRGELLVKAELPEFQDGLFIRRSNGDLEQILRQGNRLDGSDGSDPQSVRFIDRVWDFSNSGTAAFDAFTFPPFERGTYLARPEGFQQLWVPHLVSGEFEELEFSSALLIHNPGRTAARVAVGVFSSAGVRTSELAEISLAPDETRRLELQLPAAMAGWARIQVRGGAVCAFLRMSVRERGILLSEVTVPAVRPKRSALWRAGASSDRRRDTGLAVVNTGNSEAEVAIERLGAAGTPVEFRRLVLPAGGYRAILLTDLFPLPELGVVEYLLRISSPNPMALFSLMQTGGRISAVPIIQ